MSSTPIPYQQFTSASRVVFFSGAGISAESGISTFRDHQGYWSKYDPLKLASPQGFREDPELVLSWYASRRLTIKQTRPNAGHLALTNFQKLFPDSLVITQNVDGLHQAAGNAPVLELHGSIHREKCFKCGAPMTPNSGSEIHYCPCGGLARPDVVWFGENLPLQVLQSAIEACQECDLFFSIGTSNQIYPAAQLPFDARQAGAFVIEINPEETPFTAHADLVFHEAAGIILPKLYKEFYASLS